MSGYRHRVGFRHLGFGGLGFKNLRFQGIGIGLIIYRGWFRVLWRRFSADHRALSL